MKLRQCFLSLIISMMISPISSLQAAPAPDSFADIVKAASPAVVNISTTLKMQEDEPMYGMDFPADPREAIRRFFDRGMRPTNQKAISLGSGFIISADGLIVTNNHIVAEAEEIKVILEGDATKNYTAKLIGTDPKTDLALLKIDVNKPLPFINLGDSNAVEVGDWVIAIGNPFGFLGGTVTAGIISAKARYINSGLDDFLQTDAAINKGNSGGPLLNIKGEVIGINTALISTTGGNIGIGFAISSATAKPVIKQLREKGVVLRGWLGVGIQSLSTDELAKGSGLSEAVGALITEVYDNTPASHAKLRVGDVIIMLNNKVVKDASNLAKMVADTPIDSQITLKIYRDGKYQQVPVTVGKLPDASIGKGEQIKSSDRMLGVDKGSMFGMDMANINDDLRRRFNLDRSQIGVLVVSVKPDSKAEKAGIKAGDIILRVASEPVRSVVQLKPALDKMRIEKRPFVNLLVLRGEIKQFIPITLAEDAPIKSKQPK